MGKRRSLLDSAALFVDQHFAITIVMVFILGMALLCLALIAGAMGADMLHVTGLAAKLFMAFVLVLTTVAYVAAMVWGGVKAYGRADTIRQSNI